MRRAAPLGQDLAVVTNDLGEFVLLNHADLDALHRNALALHHPRRLDIEARGLLSTMGPSGGLSDVVKRTRKAFVMEGPALHIFVVTLRCDHACQYCQVSRANLDADGFDMSEADAAAAVDRVFESDAPALTIEFQGGEPALRFDLVRHIVGLAEARARERGRVVRFTMATTLHHLTDDHLVFCRDHAIHLSTSIDGPEALHAAQRVLPGQNSWARTIGSLERARAIVGHDGVVALPTITRAALKPVRHSVPRERVSALPRSGHQSCINLVG